jgi:serine/threonine protein kinase
MVTAGSELTPGTSIDRRYRIQCTLGRGGFGRTYLASDERRFGELCVLKEFVPNSQADPVVAQKLRELFQREASILHKLDHPQIPKFFAGFEEDDRLFIAQEYIDGKTYWRLLQERQRRGHTFSQVEIVTWLQDLLRVLEYLHEQNIVHRDISPDNIMLPNGQKAPVLIDFGVVKQVIPHLHISNSGDPDDLIQASVSVGKFGYAPYEQIRMGQCSPRSDLYALAVTAVVLLTGKSPSLLVDSKSLEWQWKRWVRLDPRLMRILAQMMADKPQDRYASAQLVLQDLQALLENLDSLESCQLSAAIAAKESASELSAIRPHSEPIEQVGEGTTTGPKFSNSQIAPVSELASIGELASNWSIQTTEITSGPLKTHVEPSLEPLPLSEISHRPLGHLPTLSTQVEAPLLLAKAADRPPTSPRSWLELIRVVVLRLPQDRLGNSKPPLRLSLKQIVVLGVLALLPIGGAVVGVQSAYITSVCWVLGNCADDHSSEKRYHQALEQADSASVLTNQARTVDDLQKARERLANSIAQLKAFPGSSKVYAAAATVLPKYQTLLKTLDESLEKETRAAQLLNRAEAEAQKANEQTKLAKTSQQYQTAQLEWRRVLATLAAIPSGTFVKEQATSRIQEYTARLTAVKLKVASTTPAPSQGSAQSITTVIQQNLRSVPPSQVRIATAPPANPSTSSPTRPQATQPAQKARSAQPANRSNSSAARSSHRAASTRLPVSPPARPPQTPHTSPLEVDSRWIAGSVVTSATQTLNDVAIWIDGKRTEADGKFVATLWIQNRSKQGFGFVTLYAESKTSNGQTVRSRVLFTGTSDTTLEPGESLSGQIYLLDRPDPAQQLTLVLQESTSGDRTFRVPF